MTTALVLAARKTDPREYDEGVDILRGIFEPLLFLCIIYNVFAEMFQFKRYIEIFKQGSKHIIQDNF